MRPKFSEGYSKYMLSRRAIYYLDKISESLSLLTQQIKESVTTGEKVITHVVKDGEDIRTITNRYYGNVDLWRKLAKYNNIIDKVSTSDIISIPTRSVLDGL
jgi:nucleoid-associated protein YgaU